MLVHRLRRWTSIKITSAKCLVFAGWVEIFGIDRYVGLMLSQRRRRYSNIKPTFYQRHVFAGIVTVTSGDPHDLNLTHRAPDGVQKVK